MSAFLNSGRSDHREQGDLTGRFRLRFQPVDATLCRNFSAQRKSLQIKGLAKDLEGTPRAYRREYWQIRPTDSPIARLAGASRANRLFALSARSSVEFAAQALQACMQNLLA